jgi:hypothetical protein
VQNNSPYGVIPRRIQVNRTFNISCSYLLGGAMALTLCAEAHGAATKGNEALLHALKGGTDGANPAAALVADGSGDLYGTAPSGGITSCRLLGHFGGQRYRLAQFSNL